jgi:opacity protein-like surface antigen
MRLIVPLLLATAAALPASAQDSAWTYKAVIYAWIPALDTSFETDSFGTVEGSQSSNDVLGDLNFAFMGSLEAQTGRFSLIGDLVYASITMDADTPKGALFSEGQIKTDVTALSGYGMYRVSTDPSLAFDLGVGFRAFSVDATASLIGNDAKTRSVGGSSDWVDPLVAARLVMPFGEKWSGLLFGDVGGAGSSSTWQVIATANYKLGENWTMNAGYRYMSVEKDLGDAAVPTTISLSGPLIGFTYSF